MTPVLFKLIFYLKHLCRPLTTNISLLDIFSLLIEWGVGADLRWLFLELPAFCGFWVAFFQSGPVLQKGSCVGFCASQQTAWGQSLCPHPLQIPLAECTVPALSTGLKGPTLPSLHLQAYHRGWLCSRLYPPLAPLHSWVPESCLPCQPSCKPALPITPWWVKWAQEGRW